MRRAGHPPARWLAALATGMLLGWAAMNSGLRSSSPIERSPLQLAEGVQHYTWTHLAAVHPTGDCATAAHVAYAREPAVGIADHWYVSSQLMADVALARADPRWASELRCPILGAVAYLGRLWSSVPPGGYYPRSDLDGSNPTTRDIYADDNAIAGLAMLEAAAWIDDESERERMLLGAGRAAEYLVSSGLWDDEYGGGFWWNTQRHESDGGKPVQTVGLAVQLFARLYGLTGDATYRVWALEGLHWSDERLFDPALGLYRFGFRPEAGQPYPPPTYVSYDQAIMIEAHLDVMRAIDSDPTHLERARQLAAGLERFRSPLGGYAFELDVPQVFSAYSAWTSAGLLQLYQADREQRWLQNAEGSLKELAGVALDPSDGGAFYLVFACTPQWASLCPAGAGWAADRRKYHLSQSWMQRALALLASVRQAGSSVTSGGTTR